MSYRFFSNNKPSLRTFFLTMLYVSGGTLSAELCYYLCFSKEGIDIGYIFMYLFQCLLIVIGYFISSWIAYRSKFFPKIKNREGVHVVSFIILTILIILGIILLLAWVAGLLAYLYFDVVESWIGNDPRPYIEQFLYEGLRMFFN